MLRWLSVRLPHSSAISRRVQPSWMRHSGRQRDLGRQQAESETAFKAEMESQKRVCALWESGQREAKERVEELEGRSGRGYPEREVRASRVKNRPVSSVVISDMAAIPCVRAYVDGCSRPDGGDARHGRSR